MSIEDRIVRVGRRLEGIAGRLRKLGYRFADPGAVMPGVEAGTEEAIARIERGWGALPEAIKVFWRRVGSVDFCGGLPEWAGCEYPDPIVVYPPSVAVGEVETYLEDRAEWVRRGVPFRVPVAPDALHKENVSGGMWYHVIVPAEGADPLLQEEPHGVTFVEYLELAVRWGGFPGLEGCEGHGWPLREIVADGESD